jgi:hypothetical protein
MDELKRKQIADVFAALPDGCKYAVFSFVFAPIFVLLKKWPATLSEWLA